MEMKQMKLNYSPLISEAIEKQRYNDFFHYDLFSDNAYSKVIEDMNYSSSERTKMVDHLLKYNTSLNCGEKTNENILSLQNEDTFAVVAGQQAGFLLGPLYTIHKILSLLSYAKDVQRKTGKKIVPIFWIAGEDHDYDEVNHLYFEHNDDVKKWIHPQKTTIKKPLTNIQFESEHASIIQEVFQFVEETPYTKEVYSFIEEQYKRSTGWVDFFARLVLQLFKEEGLIVVDAHNPELRKMEINHFQTLIENTEAIQAGLKETQSILRDNDYSLLINMDETCAHIFYVSEYGRQQLYYDKEQNLYFTKNGNVKMSKDELLAELEIHPENFSTNVVTRPVMQQMIFPAVAFVSGPGEFGYWAELKGVFEAIHMKMPIVLLRHGFTYVETNVLSKIQKMGLELEDISAQKIKDIREQHYSTSSLEEAKLELDEVQEEIVSHMKLSLQRVNEDAFDQLLFNKKIEQTVAEVLKKEMEKSYINYVHMKKEKVKMYSSVLQALYPKDSYQERVYNMIYFLNKYGFDWIDYVKSLELGQKDEHYMILL